VSQPGACPRIWRRAGILLAVALLVVTGCMTQGNRTPRGAAADATSLASESDEGFRPLSRHGVWLLVETEPSFPVAFRCAAITLPLNTDGYEAMFVVSAANAFFIHQDGLDPGASIIFLLDAERAAVMERMDDQVAQFAPGDDYAAIATLANAPDSGFGVGIDQRRELTTYVFGLEGFREAYAEAGRECGFDTRPVLQAY